MLRPAIPRCNCTRTCYWCEHGKACSLASTRDWVMSLSTSHTVESARNVRKKEMNCTGPDFFFLFLLLFASPWSIETSSDNGVLHPPQAPTDSYRHAKNGGGGRSRHGVARISIPSARIHRGRRRATMPSTKCSRARDDERVSLHGATLKGVLTVGFIGHTTTLPPGPPPRPRAAPRQVWSQR